MHRVLSQIRGGGWLTNDRMAGYAWILLTCELLGFAFFVAGTHGLIVPLHHPTSSDFVSFYAAGRLADQGTAWLAYDHAAHYAAEQQATAPGIAYNYFYYPPVFLLICAVLARLPYLWAFIAFQAGSLAACLLAVRPILRNTKLVLLLAFPAVFWTLGTGQNALLTAGLFAAATWHIDRRPIVAGLLFGALCYKPHFGLLIPIALLAGGHGRAFVAAAGAVTGIGRDLRLDVRRAVLDCVFAGYGRIAIGLHHARGRPRRVGKSVWRLVDAGTGGVARQYRAGDRDIMHGRGGWHCLAAPAQPAGPRRGVVGGDTGGNTDRHVLRPDAGRNRNRLAGASWSGAWFRTVGEDVAGGGIRVAAAVGEPGWYRPLADRAGRGGTGSRAGCDRGVARAKISAMRGAAAGHFKFDGRGLMGSPHDLSKTHAKGPFRAPLPLESVLKEGFERKIPRICRPSAIHAQTNIRERPGESRASA